MHHTPGSQKQEALEEGMRVQVEHSGRIGSDTASDKHVSDLRDCRVGQNPLDVVLREGHGGGIDSRDSTNDGDNLGSGPGKRVQEVHPGDHIDSGRDHCRGVDQSADRGRTLHRVGKPDIQRNLGGFSRRPHKQKDGDQSG